MFPSSPSPSACWRCAPPTSTKTKHEAAGNERSVVTNKLFGRQRELVDVFQSLFDDDVRSGHVLSTGHKMNMVVLSGVIGIGKGAMLNAIERKLQYLARADKTCPMAILRNRHNVLQKKDTPLGIWQVMLRKLFLSFRKIHLERIVMREEQEKNQAAAGGESHSSEVPPLATANTLTSLEGDGNFDDVINAIRHLIPDNLHAGLLMLLEWTSDEVALDYVSSLSSQDSAILQQLIVCSVKAYVEIVKKFVLIIM
ncbi:hypothetical protein EON64_02715 [archaeon]|nr:MAG: hypothetical protein EON64_02715 [archaeon]